MSKKILIVDDSKTILKLNSRIVSVALPDSEITVFESPLKTIEALKANNITFDFAFLDYNMEGMNGVELAQALVDIQPAPISYKNICIVSANIQEAVINKAEALGIEFMSKPLDDQKIRSFFSSRGIAHG